MSENSVKYRARNKNSNHIESAIKQVSKSMRKILKKELDNEIDRPTLGTPHNVEVLLHCHYSPEPHPRRSVGAVKECLDWLLELGVIEHDRDREENVFNTTALGKAWVQAICNTSMPKQLFVDENGKVLNE